MLKVFNRKKHYLICTLEYGPALHNVNDKIQTKRLNRKIKKITVNENQE